MIIVIGSLEKRIFRRLWGIWTDERENYCLVRPVAIVEILGIVRIRRC